VVGSGLVGGLVLGVLSLALVADLSYETVAVVHVLDGLLAAVGEVDGVAALGLVAVAGLRVAEVGAGVAVGDAVVVVVLGWDLERWKVSEKCFSVSIHAIYVEPSSWL